MIFYLHIRKFTLHLIDIFIILRSCSNLVIVMSLYKSVERQYTTSTFDVFHNNISRIDGWIPFISIAQYAYNSENHHFHKKYSLHIPQYYIGTIISLHYIPLT
jgi:hypothetical protein